MQSVPQVAKHLYDVIYAAEIRKRNEQLRMLVHRLKQSESDHCNNESILEATQTQLAAAQKAVDRCSVIQHDLEAGL